MFSKLFALAFGLVVAHAAAAETTGLEVTGAWARATPGGSTIGAAYLTITSPTADRLTGAATPIAKKAELHTMSMEGNVMKMRPVASIDIPAGQPVALKPGGYHIMLTGLSRPLRAGQSFALTLTFEKAGQREVTVAVENTAAMGPPGQAAPRGGMSMPMHH